MVLQAEVTLSLTTSILKQNVLRALTLLCHDEPGFNEPNRTALRAQASKDCDEYLTRRKIVY